MFCCVVVGKKIKRHGWCFDWNGLGHCFYVRVVGDSDWSEGWMRIGGFRDRGGGEAVG